MVVIQHLESILLVLILISKHLNLKEMNKINIHIKTLFLIVTLTVLSACSEDFLVRSPEDNYVASTFYNSPEQIQAGVNPLYGGVWFDYYRSLMNIGDVMAGNRNAGNQNAFYTFSINPTSSELNEAYASLWMAVAYANSVFANIKQYAPATVSDEVKNTAIGEALVMKSMAYFFLVRCFGDIPIIHNSNELVATGVDNVSKLPKNKREDVYEYITLMLKEAATLLPTENDPGRIHRWSAYGLLAKVYLTRSGVGQAGSRSQEHLDESIKYASMVMNESGLQLWPEYKELFWISTGNYNPENLISLHWTISNQWGSQNALQADLAPVGMTSHGDGWGAWDGVTLDLINLFNEDSSLPGLENRVYDDDRRAATIMLDGDHYPEIWRSQGGYTMHWNGSLSDEEIGSGGRIQNNTGSMVRKHIVGHADDHRAEIGRPSQFMKTDLSTHILRLSDIYLVYAEAVLGNNGSTQNPEALQAFNAVRRRAGNEVDINELTLQTIYDERRRELAFEGDNWFDFVRLSYYDMDRAIQLLSNQERGHWEGDDAHSPDGLELESISYAPTPSDFTLPIPEVEILANPKLAPDVEPEAFDFSSIEF